ncbi:unnamed protein product [Rotaria sp. Silwood1]|nr:unnamed protein product [Rotaria sp. Silwood1]CAF1320807.1 unnamed protein product [Rotaria sp. Silwood1]CAF3520516.1 unnamed protein product [Rotaria sp. Silwood1]CAF4832057.1 unnamed protein product [Rotaria sp. Silwood1]
MRSTYSDTIAREQQIRELTHEKKIVSSIPTARTRQGERKFYEIFILAIIHFLFAVFILGRFTINNGPLIQQVYYAFIDTSNDTLNETPLTY